LNKIPSESVAKRLRDHLEAHHIRVIGEIHQDNEIFESSLEGRPINSGVAAADVDKILDFLFP